MTSKHQKVALIIGAGDGIGFAVSKAFAAEGYTICAARRDKTKLDPLVKEIVTAGGAAHAYGVDSTKEEAVVALVKEIESTVGPIEVAVFNAATFTQAPVLETSSAAFRDLWEVCAFAGFLFGREAARAMTPRGSGTILFTGATASVRGGSGFSAFAAGKFALRGVAQSLARELGPKGIHVAHVIVDGIVDGSRARSFLRERGDQLAAQGALLRPEDIAANYVHLHKQPRSAWSHELDLRPFREKW